MIDNKIQIGIIGIGMYAVNAHVPALRATEKAEILAISRRSEKALASAKETVGVDHAFTDWRELLEVPGLDAVLVATAHHVHTEPTLAAIEKGLPELVEKPIALTSSDAWSIVEAAQRANTLLAVGYNRRSAAVWRATKDAVEGGRVGTVRHVNVVFSLDLKMIWEDELMPDWMMNGVPEGFFGDGRFEGWWRRNPDEMGGGTFADSGNHIVDLVLWLGGAPAVTVSALTQNAGLPVERIATVQARLANDVLISVSMVDGVPAKGGQLTILGDDGKLSASWKDWDSDTEVFLDDGDGDAEPLVVDYEDSNTSAEFVAGVLGGPSHLATPVEAAHVVAFTEATYLSAAEKRLVEIEPR